MRIFEAGKLEVPKICGNWALKVQRQEEDWTFIKATFASALHVCLLLLITVTSQKKTESTTDLFREISEQHLPRQKS